MWKGDMGPMGDSTHASGCVCRQGSGGQQAELSIACRGSLPTEDDSSGVSTKTRSVISIALGKGTCGQPEADPR